MKKELALLGAVYIVGVVLFHFIMGANICGEIDGPLRVNLQPSDFMSQVA